MKKIAVILGTSRPESYTSKALDVVLDEFARHDKIHVDLIDPTHLSLLFLAEGDNRDQEEIQAIVTKADGIVFSTPEYHGSMSSVAKLIIENLSYPRSR